MYDTTNATEHVQADSWSRQRNVQRLRQLWIKRSSSADNSTTYNSKTRHTCANDSKAKYSFTTADCATYTERPMRRICRQLLRTWMQHHSGG